MRTPTADRDASLAAAYAGVGVCGALIVLGAAMLMGWRTALGAASGAVLAGANLWLVERVVRVYLRADKARWMLLAVVKMAIVCGGLALLVRAGIVDLLPLLAGYGALPMGIVVGTLVPPQPRTEES